MEQHEAGVLGVTWYTRENYAVMRSLFADGNTMPETYDVWFKQAQKTIHFLQKQGFILVKVMLEPERFPHWCRQRGFAMDAPARAEYARFISARTPLIGLEKIHGKTV